MIGFMCYRQKVNEHSLRYVTAYNEIEIPTLFGMICLIRTCASNIFGPRRLDITFLRNSYALSGNGREREGGTVSRWWC